MNTEVNQQSLNSTAINDVLSERHREILSGHAQKMFLALWFKMARNVSTEAWFSDEQISIKARVLLQYIPGSRAELVNAGLVTVHKGSTQWRYVYVEQDVEPVHARDLDEAIR
jgi:hypothetical protein